MIKKVSNINTLIPICLINDLCKIIDKDDIKFDQESKMMYSTDASIYHMEPICIIFPKNDEIVKSGF